jgi:hypothetical protein
MAYAPRPFVPARGSRPAAPLRRRGRRGPRALRWLTVGAAVASVVLAWLPGLLGLPAANGRLLGAAPWYLPLIALVVVLGGLLDVALPVGRSRWPVRGLDLVGAGLLYLCPGPGLWAGSLLAAGVFYGLRRTKRRPLRALEYSVASGLLQIAGAVVLVDLMRWAGVGPVPSACAGFVVGALMRHVMAAAGVALTARRPFVSQLLPRLPAELVTSAGNGAVGLLAGWLLDSAPLGLAGLIVPGLVVASTYEVQARRSAEARLFAALAAEQQFLAGRSLDQSVNVLMTVVARMLGGADVELLLSGPEGLVRYTGDENGRGTRAASDLHALDAPWVRRLLAANGVFLASEDGRPSCAFVVGGEQSPRALAIARRPRGGAAFSRQDTVFARALARQASAWLAPAADAGPDRDPRLEVVRDISRRILASPEPAADPEWSSLLLDEVHALERAVAALLGSAPDGSIPSQRDRRSQPLTAAERAALEEAGDDDFTASEPQAGTVAEPQPRRPADEWTTTGRLA